ncbi:MAG: hypothetical protein GX931_00690 [Acholeplasmataceae bacterium]|nr:hypothetical protein [Acholeplasmataceae bacterium]
MFKCPQSPDVAKNVAKAYLETANVLCQQTFPKLANNYMLNQDNVPTFQHASSPYYYIMPMVINYMFAIEMMFKSSLMWNAIEFELKHDLEYLFQLLTQSEKDKIIDRVIGNGPNASADFMTKLQKIKNTFVEWRYLPMEINGSEEIYIPFLVKLANSI